MRGGRRRGCSGRSESGGRLSIDKDGPQSEANRKVVFALALSACARGPPAPGRSYRRDRKAAMTGLRLLSRSVSGDPSGSLAPCAADRPGAAASGFRRLPSTRRPLPLEEQAPA